MTGPVPAGPMALVTGEVIAADGGTHSTVDLWPIV